jgi:hypothetical protein
MMPVVSISSRWMLPAHAAMRIVVVVATKLPAVLTRLTLRSDSVLPAGTPATSTGGSEAPPPAILTPAVPSTAMPLPVTSRE